MPPEQTWPPSKIGYQDSNNESPTTSGRNSPVFVAKQIVSERGAVILAIAAAVGMAAWALARVDSLKDSVRIEQQHTRDHIDESDRIMNAEIEHYKEAYVKLERQYRMSELKLDDWSVVAHRAGLQLPGDYARGPQGDLDAESFHINRSK